MSHLQRAILIAIVVVLLLSILLGWSMMFTVNEREQAVVLQFGDPVRECKQPGLYFKAPYQEVRKLPKTYQFWNGSGTDILPDVLTADGKKIEVTPWAVWRITDPIRFVQVLRSVENAELRVSTFVRSAIREEIKANKLVEAVRTTDRPLPPMLAEESEELSDSEAGPQTGSHDARLASGQTGRTGEEADDDSSSDTEGAGQERIKVGRERIVERIRQHVREKLARGEEGEEVGERGIELINVGIAKIDFVDIVRDAAFQRLIAFMESIAEKNEAEGEQAKKEILNQTNADIQKIEGEGKGEANRIRGEVDATIIKKYADAIKETGEFYNFIRTLEVYKGALGTNTRLVLTTDSELFKLLKTVPPAPPPSSGDAPADQGTPEKTR
jgi:membrane protease subunit HflC